MSKGVYWVIIASLLIILALFIRDCVNRQKHIPEPGVYIKETRDTIYRIDTVKIQEPKLVYKKVVDSIPYPVYINGDTIDIQIPIAQLYYAESALYDIWISGYECKIDSMFVYPKTTEITWTIEKTIVTPPKIFGACIYLGVGAQYGVITRKFDFGPQVGIGVYIRLQKRKR